MAYIFDLSDAWSGGGAFTGIKLNVTDGGSTAGSLLMDLQVGGVSQFNIGKTGNVNLKNAWAIVGGSFGLDITRDGTSRLSSGFGFNITSLTIANTPIVNLNLGGASTTDPNIFFGSNLALTKDAANTLAQRNGVNAQAFNLYNTYTDASNYERGVMKWASNLLLIDTEKLGTGVQRHIRIGTANTGVGLSNGTATGVYAVACGNSQATNNYTFAAGESTASGSGSMALGRGTSATGGNSIGLGYLSQAYQTNQFAFSNRWIGSVGDCQMSMFVLGAATTDTAATEMSTSLGSMTRIVVRASTTWAFEITVAARSDGGVDNATYMYRGMIKRDASNNTTLVGTVDNFYTNETNAAWDVAVTADDTTESLKVMVTGAAATNINWTAKVILTEVGNV